ncbi:MAG TPA: PHP domain-containing protein [Bacillota bacterium]|nr:PHP domain-containing protein [Bacillota bacterium]
MDNFSRMNQPNLQDRLSALASVILEEKNRNDFPAPRPLDANNHIHTFYSFSPYSPTLAVYQAYQAGLLVAGIVDHDSVAGLREFHQAAKIAGISSTGGVEVRVRFDRGFGTINNPDQPNCMYMVAHALPTDQVDQMDAFLSPYRLEREKRNRLMCDRINPLIAETGIHLSYDDDVRPLSKAKEGGSVTERHLLFALAKKMESRLGRTPELLHFLENGLRLRVGEKQRTLLSDSLNPFFTYDLLALLKTDTTPYYIPATEEMPLAEDFIQNAKKCGAIPAYAYLGDVTESVTQDKRAQKFEDSYLEDLIQEIKKIGVPALTYMPTRNTPAQLNRIQDLCTRYHLMQISGEDINSPRQKFPCDALANPQNHHLIEAAWALIGHESLVQKSGIEHGLFGSVHQNVPLADRIRYFSTIAQKKDGGKAK